MLTPAVPAISISDPVALMSTPPALALSTIASSLEPSARMFTVVAASTSTPPAVAANVIAASLVPLLFVTTIVSVVP